MIHSATAGSCAPRALHSVTPGGTKGIACSAPADISWISRSLGSLARTGIREDGTSNGSTTTSTSSAESGNCSPPVHTSAVIPSGRPPISATESCSGSHTLIVEDAMTARLPARARPAIRRPAGAGSGYRALRICRDRSATTWPLQGPLPRLGHVIRVWRDRVRRADDDDRAAGGAKADPDDGTGGPVRVGSVRIAAEHQHVGVRRLVEQYSRGEPFGYLGAHADAGEQAHRLADRPAQHLTGRAPTSAGLPRRRDGIARDLVTCGLQGHHGQDLGRAQARLPACPSEGGHGLRGAVDADDDTPDTGIYCHD